MELTIVCIPPNGFELTKIPRILGAKSHVPLSPLAQHPVGAKRSGVGCVGSGRGIPYRILFCPLTPYNFATKWRTFPREARCKVRSLPARDWAASRLFMVTFVVADLTLDFCKEYRTERGSSTLISANSGCLVE